MTRKYEPRPSHLSAWQRMAREYDLVLPAPYAQAEFTPLVVSGVEPTQPVQDM